MVLDNSLEIDVDNIQLYVQLNLKAACYYHILRLHFEMLHAVKSGFGIHIHIIKSLTFS